MIGRNRGGGDAEQEPVTDPETGRPRSERDAPAASAEPGRTAGEEPGPHDAEPTAAEEAAVLDGEVLDVEVVEGDATGTPAPAGDEPDPVAQELAERTADLQRLSAEYANYRRRVDRDRQSVVDAAKASVAGELLGVLDDLERARSHGDLEGPLKSVADKLSAALTGQGLRSFGAVGDPFDPSLHEAVSHEGDGGEPVVALVMRQGYRFGERVLRPAMVGVGDAPAGAEPKDDTVPGPGGDTAPGPGATTTDES